MMKNIMEAFRKNVIAEESAEERAKAMYDMGKKDGLAGEGKDQRNHIKNDDDYIKGYSAGVAKRRGESKGTNEAKGSGSGEGISPKRAEELVRAAAEKHRPGRAPILAGTLQSLVQWGRKNLPGMTTSEARKAIEEKMKPGKINKKD